MLKDQMNEYCMESNMILKQWKRTAIFQSIMKLYGAENEIAFDLPLR